MTKINNLIKNVFENSKRHYEYVAFWSTDMTKFMFDINEVKQLMIEYSDLKVKEALEIAADNCVIDYIQLNNTFNDEDLEVFVIKDSILNIKLPIHE